MCLIDGQRLVALFSLMRNFYLVFLSLCLLTSFKVFANEDSTAIPANIQKLFPSATRVGAQHTDIPVIPVYQLQQLLGYAFESRHFANFIGFTGKPINMLIGIDDKGRFIDVLVLEHAEPIFLHGLGEQSMLDYVAQYKGHNVKDRFIIGNNRSAGVDAVYFDGVTKATVSILVINDTIITSALKVARSKLDGFLPLSNKIINPEYFVESSFTELVENGYIVEHNIYSQDFESAPSQVMSAGEEYFEEDGLFSQHYYAFLNYPIVGKNLLSSEEYARLQQDLKPGEIALMVLHTRGYSFISDEFIPQTHPENFRMYQGDLPLPARDTDFYSFYDAQFKIELPEYQDVKILKLKSQSGMDLSQQIDIAVSLTYAPTFFEREDYLFNKTVVFPESLFMENPEAILAKPKPLWVQIWESRVLEITLVSIYLIVVTFVFVYQKKYVKHTNFIHNFRFISLIFCLFFIGFYAQGQLSVVNIYTLLLSIKDGFQIGVFLLDPVIFILWCFVFVSLFLFGRGLYCGWLCPFGALQEFFGMLATKLKIKQIKVKDHHHAMAIKIKYFILIGIVGSAFYSFTLAEILSEAEPFKTAITLYFVRYWPFVLYAVILVALSMKIHKFYCRYLCPLGAGLAVLGRFPIFKLLRRREECGSPCHLCKQKKCGINAINADGSIDYTECVQCLECVVTLDNPNICKIDKYKKKPVGTRVQAVNIV